jgi:hypothetical protein
LKKILGSLVAVLVLGTVGYALIEQMSFSEAVISTFSVMTTNGLPAGMTTAGKIFTVALSLAAIGLAVTALSRFLNPPIGEGADESITNTNIFSPSNGAMMKEVKMKVLVGKRKDSILEEYGLMLIGIKHRGGFEINLPLGEKVKSGDSVLLMGNPAAFLNLEKKK